MTDIARMPASEGHVILKIFSKLFAPAKAEKRFNLDRQGERHWAERASDAVDMLIARDRIQPIASLADIGCGNGSIDGFARILGFTPEYFGFDLIPQNSTVKTFDIMRDTLPRHFDAAMVLGVLEYVEDARAALARIRPYTDLLIVSHAVKETRTGVTPRKQRKLGWLTFLTSDEFARVITDAGFVIEKTKLTADQRTRLWLCH